MADLDALKEKAQQVRNEVQIGANTASKVGYVMEATVDRLQMEIDRAKGNEENLLSYINDASERITENAEAITDVSEKTQNNKTALSNYISVSTMRIQSNANAIKQQEKEIDTLKDLVENYKPIIIEGDVANAPDEEDITAQEGLLKLKDRNAIGGMGYIILRKDKTIAEQMVHPDTIYEIRYDFDLSEEQPIIVPANCVLKFVGGSLRNATIVGNITTIDAGVAQIFTINNTFVNTFVAPCVYPEWFGAKADYQRGTDIGTDDTDAIQAAIELAYSSSIYLVKLIGRSYYITHTIYMRPGVCMDGRGADNYYFGPVPKLAARFTNPDSYIIDSCAYDEDGNQYSLLAWFDSRKPVYDEKGKVITQCWKLTNVSMQSLNNIFGGFRNINCIQSVVSEVSMYGTRIGFFLAKGWNGLITNVSCYTHLFGCFVGGEITVFSFDSVQFTKTNEGYEPNATDIEFFNTYYRDEKFNSIYPDYDEDIMTVGIYCDTASCNWTAATSERYDIALKSQRSELNFDTFYVEAIQQSIVYLFKEGHIYIKNMIGLQSQTQSYTYICTEMIAGMVLDDCHPGTFYAPYSNWYHRMFHNSSLYTIINQQALKFVPYTDTAYLNYNIGTSVFVDDTVDDEVSSQRYGVNFRSPINLKTALERLSTNPCYASVERIVIAGTATLNNDAIIDSKNHIAFDGANAELVINAILNIKSPVTFNTKVTINAIMRICADIDLQKDLILNMDLCSVYGKKDVSISLPSTVTESGELRYVVGNWQAFKEGAPSNIFIELGGKNTSKLIYDSLTRDGYACTQFYFYHNGTLWNKVGGTTAQRPQYYINWGKFAQFFDTTINKPIWWTGTAWVDANGNNPNNPGAAD